MGLYVSEVMWWLYRPLAFMIWGGVFERFPKLKACLTEGGTNWMLEPWLRMLDFHATAGPESAKNQGLYWSSVNETLGLL